MRRPNDFGGRFRRLLINVDGHQVAMLKPNEHAMVELTPGRHVLVGAMDWVRSADFVVEVPVEGTLTVEISLPFKAVMALFSKSRQAIRVRQVPVLGTD